MLGQIFTKATQRRSRSTNVLVHFYQKREVHNRNKKSMEYLGRGWSALQEVDRVIDYADLHDQRLIPLLRAARENFELALSADSTNVHARYWLGRLHLRYEDTPLASKAVGAALLVEAANMGFKDAQYEVGWWIRKEIPHAKRDQQALYYIKKAAEQLQPDSLYLLGIMYLAGDWVLKDEAMAISYFHKASLKNHAGAAIACGSLLLKGVEIPESLLRLSTKKAPITQRLRHREESRPKDRREMAKEQFEIAARAGCDLGLKWLEILEEEKILEDEKNLLES